MRTENTPYIAGAATAFPEYYYKQQELTAALQEMWAMRASNRERLGRLHRNLQIEGRHVALPLEELMQPASFQERNDAWIRIALELGEQSICQLLEQEQMGAEEISLFAFTSISGIAAPSIDARLMNCIPFGPDLKRMPLFGLGCMGGAGGLALLADYLVGHPREAALLLSVELCSLTIQHDDRSVENMVATGLFADGAAAVLMTGAENARARPGQPRVIANRSFTFPGTEYVMGWDIRDSGFKVVLSADVAEVLGPRLRPVMDAFLEEHGLTTAQIEHWLVHPGGPKIIEAVESELHLPEGALDASREVLAAVGNVSSATVLIMLERALREQRPRPGTYGLLMAMGPGFSAELILLEW